MDILGLHNYYQQPGGEDQVFSAETALLRSKGHKVIQYTRHNDQIAHMKRLDLARATVWNRAVYQELRILIRQVRPQVIHLHNTFPLLSPAVYYAAKSEGIPVVQTLHNYRLFCLNALFFRDGRVCEDCCSHVMPWPGIRHACYRQSPFMSGGVATMLVLHRLLRTWTNTIDVYIALTEFAKAKFLARGLPEEKILVKPNFLHPDPGMEENKEEFALFVGRLSVEKGLDTLLQAWTQVRDIPLKIVGDGPLMSKIVQSLEMNRLDHVHVLGRRSHKDVIELVKRARCLVFPSECYENFPTVIMEAFACGTPVIASRLGVAGEVIQDGQTGVHFSAADAMDLATKVEWIWTHPQRATEMGQRARREYEQKYTAIQNYRALLDIYETVAARI